MTNIFVIALAHGVMLDRVGTEDAVFHISEVDAF